MFLYDRNVGHNYYCTRYNCMLEFFIHEKMGSHYITVPRIQLSHIPAFNWCSPDVVQTRIILPHLRQSVFQHHIIHNIMCIHQLWNALNTTDYPWQVVFCRWAHNLRPAHIVRLWPIEVENIKHYRYFAHRFTVSPLCRLDLHCVAVPRRFIICHNSFGCCLNYLALFAKNSDFACFLYSTWFRW